VAFWYAAGQAYLAAGQSYIQSRWPDPDQPESATEEVAEPASQTSEEPVQPQQETPSSTAPKEPTVSEYGPAELSADTEQAAVLAEELSAAQAAAAAAASALSTHISTMTQSYMEVGGWATKGATIGVATLASAGGENPNPDSVLDILPSITAACTDALGLGETSSSLEAEGDVKEFEHK
jgi:hypothetical protein